MRKWNEPNHEAFVMSYSGGKDSTLALWEAKKSAELIGLIVMLDELGQKSGAYGLSRSFLKAQADSIGAKVYFGCASWEGYEAEFSTLLRKAKEDGAKCLVSGDLDDPELDCWNECVANKSGLSLYMPLWCKDHIECCKKFISEGFSSVVCCVNTKNGMKREDLGRVYNEEFICELITRGIDPAAEAGEFHTAAVSGPMFSFPINYQLGEISEFKEYLLIDITAQ